MLTRIHVGIDISSKWFDAGVAGKEDSPVVRYKNTPEGQQAFIDATKPLAKKVFVCMEHTGGYEAELATACHHENFIVSLVSGSQISDYRKSFGSAKAKSDQKDALLLARFCKERKPIRWSPVPDDYLALKERVHLRENLIEQKKRLGCQAVLPVQSAYVSTTRKTLLEVIELSLKDLEKQIKQIVEQSVELKRDVKLLVSISGIAFQSAIRILSESGPISNYSSAKEFALAAGLAPIVFQSGTRTPPGKLPVYGNKNLRRAFYFPAVVNFRKKTAVGAFMQRLEQKGNKAKMTVIVAGMRKLAHIVYGVLKNQKEFDPDLV